MGLQVFKARVIATENLGSIWSNVLMIQIGKLRFREERLVTELGQSLGYS